MSDSTHMFIISNDPTRKPDPMLDHERRAHVARQTRKKIRKNSIRRDEVKQISATIPTEVTFRFGRLGLPESLVKCLTILKTFSHDEKGQNILNETHQELVRMYSRVDGLAFLKPSDVYYEASRYAALIHCEILAQKHKVELVTDSGKPYAPHALHYVLNSLFIDTCWNEQPDFMIWSLSMGYNGTQRDDYDGARTDFRWYAEQLMQRCIVEHRLSDVEQYREMLCHYLWVHDDELMLKLWEDMRKVQIREVN